MKNEDIKSKIQQLKDENAALSQKVENASKAVIKLADNPDQLQRLFGGGTHTSQSIRMYVGQIAEMHRRGDYSHARSYQIAQDALGHMTISEMQALCAWYEA